MRIDSIFIVKFSLWWSVPFWWDKMKLSIKLELVLWAPPFDCTCILYVLQPDYVCTDTIVSWLEINPLYLPFLLILLRRFNSLCRRGLEWLKPNSDRTNYKLAAIEWPHQSFSCINIKCGRDSVVFVTDAIRMSNDTGELLTCEWINRLITSIQFTASIVTLIGCVNRVDQLTVLPRIKLVYQEILNKEWPTVWANNLSFSVWCYRLADGRYIEAAVELHESYEGFERKADSKFQVLKIPLFALTATSEIALSWIIARLRTCKYFISLCHAMLFHSSAYEIFTSLIQIFPFGHAIRKSFLSDFERNGNSLFGRLCKYVFVFRFCKVISTNEVNT